MGSAGSSGEIAKAKRREAAGRKNGVPDVTYGDVPGVGNNERTLRQVVAVVDVVLGQPVRDVFARVRSCGCQLMICRVTGVFAMKTYQAGRPDASGAFL